MEFNKFENMLNEFKKIYVKRPKRNQTFLEVSGFPNREVVCSNILKFYLDNTEEHELGSMVLEALLKAANINNLDNTSDLTIEREYGVPIESNQKSTIQETINILLVLSLFFSIHV